MNFGAMKAEVRRKLAEHSSGLVYWTASEIGDAVNAGLMEISDATEWNEAHVRLPLLSHRRYYDLRTAIGETFLAIRPAFDDQTNRWLIPSTTVNMDARDRRWEMSDGEPERLFTRGPFILGVWPEPQTDFGTLKQYYVGLPDPLVDDEDEPAFPETWHYACVDFALTDLWAMDGETAFALQAWAAYLEGETALAAWVNHRAAEAARTGLGTEARC